MPLPYKVRGMDPFGQLQEQIRRNLGILPTPDFRAETIQDENDQNDPNWQGPREANVLQKAFPVTQYDDRVDSKMFEPPSPTWAANQASRLPRSLQEPGGRILSVLGQGLEYAAQPENAAAMGAGMLRTPEPPAYFGQANFKQAGYGATDAAAMENRAARAPRLNEKPPTQPYETPFGGDRTTGQFMEGSGGLADIAAGRTSPHPSPNVAPIAAINRPQAPTTKPDFSANNYAEVDHFAQVHGLTFGEAIDLMNAGHKIDDFDPNTDQAFRASKTIAVPPEFAPTDYTPPDVKPMFPETEQTQYDLARDKFNMGRDLPEPVQGKFGAKKATPRADINSMADAADIAADFGEDITPFKTAKGFHDYMEQKYGPEYTKALNGTLPANEIPKVLPFGKKASNEPSFAREDFPREPEDFGKETKTSRDLALKKADDLEAQGKTEEANAIRKTQNDYLDKHGPADVLNSIRAEFYKQPNVLKRAQEIHDEQDLSKIVDNHNKQHNEFEDLLFNAPKHDAAFNHKYIELSRLRQLARSKYDRATLRQLNSEYQPSSNDPQFARTEGGGTSMDIGDKKDMIRVFRNTYSGSIPQVATKELVQNAIDAVSDMGAAGRVNVKTNAKTGEIQVSDNGPGLTRDDIDTVYTNLSSSGKRGTGNRKIGELGVGKTTYMVAGKHVAVDTVAREPSDGKLYRHTFEGTPEELMDEFHPVKTEVPEGTPTGTTVTMQSPDGSKYEGLGTYLNHFGNYSSNPVPVHIEHEPAWSWETAKITDVPIRNKVVGKDLGGEDLPETKYNVTIPDDATWGESDRIPLILNNRGMFQGVDQHYIGGNAEVPDRLVIDLDPNVSATDPLYPLTAPTRESLKHDTRYTIGKYINKHLVDDLAKKRNDEVERVYNKLENSPDRHIIYDGGERYTPQELDQIKNSKAFNKIGDIVHNIVSNLSSVIPTAGRKVSRTGFIFDKLRGVNLKLQGNNNIMLMVNPFSEMRADTTPKEAAQGIVHIVLHEFTHVNVRSEGAEFTAHLATVYEKFDLEKQIEARDKILAALTDQALAKVKSSYTTEVENLLQKYHESRGRDATSKDLLLREAGSGFLGQEKRSDIPSGGESDGIGTVKPIEGKSSGRLSKVDKLK